MDFPVGNNYQGNENVVAHFEFNAEIQCKSIFGPSGGWQIEQPHRPLSIFNKVLGALIQFMDTLQLPFRI